jgi:hypothetical protein
MSWKSAISRLSPSRADGIAGFEALAHWTHQNRGTLAGEALMLLAEEIGLAVEVAEWTLRRSLAQAARWSLPVKVAVNIVSLQLRRNLLDPVLQALAASRLPSDRLELEIAESLLRQDNQTTPALLHQLRQLGVRIVLDDFGTGYGSLGYLRSFPFDKVTRSRADCRRGAGARRGRAGRGHHRPGRKTRHDHACRRRRERATARLDARPWLHRSPRLLFRRGGTSPQNRADARARCAPAGRLSFLQRNA